MSWVITGSEKVPVRPFISNTVAWWDAAEASTFTFSSGTVVQNWASIVGSYTLTQATSANRPERAGTVNGLPTVVFDGTNDSLSVVNFDMTPGGQKLSIWAVFSATTGSDQVLLEQTSTFFNNPGAFIFYRTSADRVQIAKSGTAGSANAIDSTDTLTTTPKCVIGFHDGALSTNESNIRLNAVDGGTRPANNNTNSNNINAILHVGARAGTSLFLNGQICEFGISTSILTATEIALLESYLSRKWGLGF
jgi:hypothetical protein